MRWLDLAGPTARCRRPFFTEPRMRWKIPSCILMVLAASDLAVAETKKFVPMQKGAQSYAVREPVLRIKAGDTLESHTLFSDFYTAETGGSGYPGEVGPIFIEGATPQDTLVVRIVKIGLK